ncbi:MAG: 2-C-methyl-D-erythritol 4-phosphate cytidylyltransferase [Bacteroidetes bacterium]|nr:2-C-methyl-D-erythritol 4-phosphate cytidylyltransferase [Bacteroidota bacterium]
MNTIAVIITAGGIGKRMGGELPKQFLLLENRPILMRTIERFRQFLPQAELFVTLPTEWHREWNTMCIKHHFEIPHTTIDGGAERFHSVKNALSFVQSDIVMIHDGVRPLFAKSILIESLEKVNKQTGIVPVLAATESLRKLENGSSVSVPRGDFRLVQTPQIFTSSSLKKAYELPFQSYYTDDASVFEEFGGKIELISGNK